MSAASSRTPSPRLHRVVRLRLVVPAVLAMLAASGPVLAQAGPVAKSDTEILVPPQGSAIDVPLHAGAVCILSFPDRVSPQVVASSADFEIQPWGEDSIAVRTTNTRAAGSVALAAGDIKVNVLLRVVPASEPSLSLVRFKAATEAEAFEARVKAGIAQGLAPLQQRVEQTQKDLDAVIRRRAERLVAEQLLGRSDVMKLNSHARNSDHVILHVWRAVFLGDNGYLVFEIQNRSSSPYRLGSVRVIANGRNVAGDAFLSTSPAVRDPALIGVVAPGATVSGVVSIPLAQALLRRALTLEISMPNGRSVVRADRGIELR